MGYSIDPAYGDYRWRDPVSVQASLPASGNNVGDVRLTTTDGKLWTWSGSAWSQISGGGGGGGSFYNAGNSGSGTVTINWSNGTTQLLTLTGNPTLSFSNLAAGTPITLLLAQDSTGGRTATFPSTFHVQYQGPIPLTGAPYAVDIFVITTDGTDMFAVPTYGHQTNAHNFLPTSLLGLSLWFDGSDASSMILSGSNVTQWNDKSGNGFNATQGVSANQPTLVTNVLNGKSVVRFNGSTNYLSFGSGQVFDDTLGYTLITVFKCTATGFGRTIMEANAGHSRWLRHVVALGDSTYGDVSVSTNNGDANVRTGAIFSTTAFGRLIAVYNGAGNTTPANYTITKNNTSLASYALSKPDTVVTALAGSPFVAGTANKIGIYGDGSSNPFQGDISDIILYNRPLAIGELAMVVGYSQGKSAL
jgi:hypothetical protein